MKIISYIKIISYFFIAFCAIRGCYFFFIEPYYPCNIIVANPCYAIIYVINLVLVPAHLIDTNPQKKELDIMDHLIE